MKKLITALTVIGIAAGVAGVAFASGALRLDWRKEVNRSQCATSGEPVVNVHEKVKGDVDSGTAGNYWAFDNYERHIQVWNESSNTYCAVVSYDGGFRAIAGQTSPAGTTTLSGKERGELEGGRRATIVGTLLATPAWPLRGSVGTVDYRCDISGNCPGLVRWVGQYFSPGYSYNDDWWGWIYRGGCYGTWINAVSGNAGDIHPAVKGCEAGDRHEGDGENETHGHEDGSNDR